MFLHMKLSVCLILYLVTITTADYGQFKTKHDKSYGVIKFKIPQKLWRQAFTSIPLLKSQATVVIPIHVADEENAIDEPLETDVTEVNVAINNTLVSNDVVDDPVVTVASVTQAPEVLAEATDVPAQPVQGQVIRFPCTCIDGQCGCCTGSILERFSMKACGNITFVPEDFVFDVRLSVNNNTIVRRRVSASDPPPICFNPRRAPFVRVCLEISNIRIRNRNAYACLDINADIGGFQVYSASFRCFSLGASGLQTGLNPKPVSNGPKPVSLFPTNQNEGGTILDAAEEIIEGQGGIFGEGSSGPLDAIGEVVGNIFGGREAD